MAIIPELPRRHKGAEPISVPKSRQRFGLFLLGPGALWLLVFGIVPLGLIVVYSFATRGEYGGVALKWTWENFARLADPLYVAIFRRSLLMAGATTILCIVMGYPIAYAISTAGPHWKNRLLMLVIIPFWTNFLIRTYAWIIILRTEGLINSLLLSLGIITEPLTLLYTSGAVLVGFGYNWLPYMILPIYASLEKIDRSYIEAAMDLGGKGRVVLQKVILPLSIPGIAAGSVLVFIPALAMFAIPDVLGGARTMMIGNLIKNQFTSARNWPFGSAASVVLIGLMLLALFIYKRLAQNERS
jgi:spermidine/putrescine transport system permease protein